MGSIICKVIKWVINLIVDFYRAMKLKCSSRRRKRNLDIKDTIDENADIILGDSRLVGNGNSLFLQGMDIGNSIHKRDQKVKSRGEGLHILAESLYHKCLLLWDYSDTPVDGRVYLVASFLKLIIRVRFNKKSMNRIN